MPRGDDPGPSERVSARSWAATGFETHGYHPPYAAAPLPPNLDDDHSWWDVRRTKGELKESRRDAENAALSLQKLLLKEVGDDVTMGTVRMPCTGAAALPSEEDTRHFNIGIRGTSFDFPITQADALVLYSMMDQSMLGVEGVGDVFDENRRLSREVEVAECVLPPPLDRFFFPEAVEHFRTLLAPTAQRIGIVPYKIVAYAPGDFFGRHVDSPSNEHHFGTITLNLPCVEHYNANIKSSGTAFADVPVAQDAIEAVVGGYAVPSSKAKRDSHGGDDGAAAAAAAASSSDDEAGSSSSSSADPNDPDKDLVKPEAPAGSLNFYMTRQLSAGAQFGIWGGETNDRLVMNATVYDSPNANEALEVSSDLTKYTYRSLVADRRKADQKALAQSLPLNYAAWYTDVLHSVSRVKKGFRFMITYKVFKQGHCTPRVPLWTEIDTAVQKVFAGLAKIHAVPPGVPPAQRARPDALAVLTRHAYSPAALKPEMLRGLDAALYHVVSLRYTVYLMSAIRCRKGDSMQTRWRIEEAPWERGVVATWDPDRQIPTDIGQRESGADDMMSRFPGIARAAWVQLGHGRLMAGGHSCGNWSCAAPWWYRDAVMLVRPEPSHWQRRRWVFLIRERGARHWQDLLRVWHVERLIAGFV